MSREVVKKTVHNKLNTEANSFENKIPDAATSTHTNQCNTDKQSLEKKIRDVNTKNT